VTAETQNCEQLSYNPDYSTSMRYLIPQDPRESVQERPMSPDPETDSLSWTADVKVWPKALITSY
jgi:hypothetical protein